MVAQWAPSLLAAALLVCIPTMSQAAERTRTPTTTDIVIYGGTCAGVMAAVQATRMGKTVVLIVPSGYVGGMTSGGLGWVDVGRESTIGGLARDYFHRVWAHYQKSAAWTYGTKRAFGGQGVTAARSQATQTMWVLEPGVAERTFEEYLAQAMVPVVRVEHLDRMHGVSREGSRIIAITMVSGRTFTGRMFIDATYEGDLMAAAHVPFVIGREARTEFNEPLAGVTMTVLPFAQAQIDTHVVPGDPTSGLLPRITPFAQAGLPGEADQRVQAYGYRMCLTDEPRNRIAVQKPAGYDERAYELVFRAIAAGYPKDRFYKFSSLPNRKTDSNNNGAVSTDLIGRSWSYAAADDSARERLASEHELWQRGLIWTLQHHPRVPDDIRAYYAPWGLAKDEFVTHGNWPTQLYVREARRMRGAYVITEHDCRLEAVATDPIGIGSYAMDSHYTQYVSGPDGFLRVEGGFFVVPKRPYGISYQAVVPRRDDCINLLVPICLSASHAAYGSLRMEPVFMVLGQSVATAAALAIDASCAVQDVNYAVLRTRLLADGQRLETTAEKTAEPAGK